MPNHLLDCNIKIKIQKEPDIITWKKPLRFITKNRKRKKRRKSAIKPFFLNIKSRKINSGSQQCQTIYWICNIKIKIHRKTARYNDMENTRLLKLPKNRDEKKKKIKVLL